jgi:glyoxylase-like metal-dependent hydrolase (beta-lactamase superfamily II)
VSAGVASCASNGDAATARPQRLADGVWWLPGRPGVADPRNLGRIGNLGFIVGPTGVVAIDTGTSRAHGQAVLAAIRSVTDAPVRLALVTHTRPEFLFGGNAFQAAGIPVVMHARTARLMASRCETCLKQLQQSVGAAELQGTAMYQADRQFETSFEVEGIGRLVRVLYFGHSSGPGDIAVHDVASGVVFCGGLADVHRIPDIQDSELPGWHRALAALRALGPRVVVPGHGAPAGPQALEDVGRYLAALESGARALVDRGVSLIDVNESLPLTQYIDWEQYDTIHRRNASIAYLRIEREQFFKP